jgi:hypothetical protein
LPGYILCLFLSHSLSVQREGTLENHFDRGSGWIVDLISASEEHFGQASGSPDAAADQGSFAATSERTDDRALSSRTGDRSSVLALCPIGLDAAFFVDYFPIVCTRHIVH